MGDRVSIRFINNNTESGFFSKEPDTDAPVIFSHWGGMSFVEAAVRYAQDLIAERSGSLAPLDRLEPRTVTCDFLYNLDRYYPINLGGANHHRISHDVYIGRNENDGDNGDNGHFNIDLGSITKLDRLIADIDANASRGDYWG